jgi:hypothetical protein
MAFGADVDYAQLVKLYGPSSDSSKGRYSPAECNGIKKTPIEAGQTRSTSRLHLWSAKTLACAWECAGSRG